MKVHAGVDAGSGYVHTITGTAASVHDVNETEKLIREDDEVLYGDPGYLNAAEHMKSIDADRLKSIDFRFNVRPSSIKMSEAYKGIRWDEDIENRKSSTRCKVEHPFLIVKRQFGYCKTAYKGLAKNMNRLVCSLPVRIWLCVSEPAGQKPFVWDNFVLFQGNSPKISTIATIFGLPSTKFASKSIWELLGNVDCFY